MNKVPGHSVDDNDNQTSYSIDTTKRGLCQPIFIETTILSCPVNRKIIEIMLDNQGWLGYDVIN